MAASPRVVHDDVADVDSTLVDISLLNAHDLAR